MTIKLHKKCEIEQKKGSFNEFQIKSNQISIRNNKRIIHIGVDSKFNTVNMSLYVYISWTVSLFWMGFNTQRYRTSIAALDRESKAI